MLVRPVAYNLGLVYGTWHSFVYCCHLLVKYNKNVEKEEALGPTFTLLKACNVNILMQIYTQIFLKISKAQRKTLIFTCLFFTS